ncbi:MAG: hypothetical protein ACI4XP_05875 [Acutalibacteraceae bacterium]
MGISKYNSEGYYDPTAHEAVCNIEKKFHKYRPLVYICSPYSRDVDGNTERARQYSRYAVDTGYIPIAPHLLFPQFLNDTDPKERELGLFFGNVIMSKCSEVWVFGNNISSGMKAEINHAMRKNYRLRYFTEDYQEV